jgi:hypothetical protein
MGEQGARDITFCSLRKPATCFRIVDRAAPAQLVEKTDRILREWVVLVFGDTPVLFVRGIVIARRQGILCWTETGGQVLGLR